MFDDLNRAMREWITLELSLQLYKLALDKNWIESWRRTRKGLNEASYSCSFHGVRAEYLAKLEARYDAPGRAVTVALYAAPKRSAHSSKSRTR